MNVRTKLDDYLWKVVCEDFDEEFAYEYLKTNGDFPAAACSSIRKGNLWGRNFDYPYNNSVKFAVKNDRTEDRYASHGSAGGFSALTKAFVESGEDSDLYKVLPYMVYDGQNEYGVTANYNIVPTDHGVNYVTAKVSEEKEIPALAIIRFILDNFKSATQAVEYIRDHVSLYFSTVLHTQGNELHVMVGDKYKTYCLEFIDGETVVIDISSKPYMTNYHLYGVKFNPDGKVFTPETKLAYDATKNAYDFNHVTLHGSGLERYNLIVDMYPLIHNEHDMRTALKELYYTRAYKSSENPANPVWYTEFVGEDTEFVGEDTDHRYLNNSIVFPSDFGSLNGMRLISDGSSSDKSLWEIDIRPFGGGYVPLIWFVISENEAYICSPEEQGSVQANKWYVSHDDGYHWEEAATPILLKYDISKLKAYNSSEDEIPITFFDFIFNAMDITVKSDVSEFVSAIESSSQAYEERSRDTGLTWCTCTSVVYNLKDLTMVISSQEGDVCHVDVIKPVEDYIYGDVEFKAAQGMTPQGFRVKTKDKKPAVSDIEINPEDEATEELRKIKKDGVTYGVPESGEELPEYTEADIGKVLGIEAGELGEGTEITTGPIDKLYFNTEGLLNFDYSQLSWTETDDSKYYALLNGQQNGILIQDLTPLHENLYGVADGPTYTSFMLIINKSDTEFGESGITFPPHKVTMFNQRTGEVIPLEDGVHEFPQASIDTIFEITEVGENNNLLTSMFSMNNAFSTEPILGWKSELPKYTANDAGKVLTVVSKSISPEGYRTLKNPMEFPDITELPSLAGKRIMRYEGYVALWKVDVQGPEDLGIDNLYTVQLYINDELGGTYDERYICFNRRIIFEETVMKAGKWYKESGASYVEVEDLPNLLYDSSVIAENIYPQEPIYDLSIFDYWFAKPEVKTSLKWKEASGGIAVVEVTETMQTSTLPAQTVPALTKAQIENIRALRAAGKSVRIKNASGDYDVTEGDTTNDEIRFTYFGLYLGYYIEGTNVIAVYDQIGKDNRIPTTTSADAGKFLTVDSNGDIVVTAMETWQGGNF